MFNTPVKVDYRSKHTLIQCLDSNAVVLEEKNTANSSFGKKTPVRRDDVRHPKNNQHKEEEEDDEETSRPIDIAQSRQTSYNNKNVTNLNMSGAENECIVVTTIENILTQNECINIIALSEQSGLFKPALINIGLGREVYIPEARNSDRCIIDDVDFAEAMYERLKEFIPATHTSSGNSWKPVGLNERFRILRYSEGHEFPWHQDGNFMRNSKERSFYTLMLYLNEGGDDFIGGSTLFEDERNYKSGTTANTKHIVEYRPRTGGAVIFHHRIPHEGEKLLKGVKYAIRTDVMYRMENNTNE